MSNKNNSIIGDFIVDNAKSIMTCIVFMCCLYLQYRAVSMMKIDQMEKELVQTKVLIDNQCIQLDNMKFNKTVFEATVKQFADMSTDIWQTRYQLV